jgi:plasmid stabilization system protein ParE
VKISLSVQAELELVEGAAYYAREANADIANEFVSEFERSAKLLADFPKLGATWRGRIRRLPLRRFPYSIVYCLSDSEVRILAVAHQRRRPGFWKGRT